MKVKSLLLISLLLAGCTEPNSVYTPRQVQEASDFCKKDNTTLWTQVSEFSTGKFVVGLACKDSKDNLYKLTIDYPRKESTTDCGRGPNPCMVTDYSAPGTIRYQIND
jgi:hypothetical protein